MENLRNLMNCLNNQSGVKFCPFYTSANIHLHSVTCLDVILSKPLFKEGNFFDKWSSNNSVFTKLRVKIMENSIWLKSQLIKLY